MFQHRVKQICLNLNIYRYVILLAYTWISAVPNMSTEKTIIHLVKFRAIANLTEGIHV